MQNVAPNKLRYLLEYLNELSIKKRNRPLSEAEVETIKKWVAWSIQYEKLVEKKRKIDPITQACDYIEITEILDRCLIDIVNQLIASDVHIGSQQLSLTFFLESLSKPPQIHKIKPSDIHMDQRGANGHS